MDGKVEVSVDQLTRIESRLSTVQNSVGRMDERQKANADVLIGVWKRIDDHEVRLRKVEKLSGANRVNFTWVERLIWVLVTIVLAIAGLN